MKYRILAGFALAAVLWGQAQPAPGDAPGRAGRLSYVYGSVSFRPDSVQEWTPATVNYPLSTGDHLWTDPDAQAEVCVGLTAVHLAHETGFFITKLDETAFQMGLAEGALNVRIPRRNEGETFEVETPYGKFRLLATGSYRIDVQPEADYASIVVRAGAAEAIAGNQTFAVAPGQRAVLSGKPATVELMEAPPLDPWDEWCANRDEQAERGYEQAQQHVSWEITGAAEFVDNGEWVSDAEYGWCWLPRSLPAGWAPFRFGFWVWRAPWGWTWVDHAPWGFATSHWGRWGRIKQGWAWMPEPKRFHPKYAPHTVAFSETRGSRFVSWVPLAPGETRPIRNREFVTAATQTDFAASRPIRDARVLMIDRGATEFTGRTAAIMPTREAVLGGKPIDRPARRPSVEAVAPPPLEAPRPIEPPRPIETPVRRVDRDDEPQRREVLRRVAEEDNRQAEESRRADERRRAAEEARRLEDNRQSEESRRADESRRAAEESRRQDESRRAEESRRAAEESRRQDESRRAADEARRQEDNRRQEEHRRAAEESRRQDESRRAAEESRRQDESRRAAEESRRQDESRRAAEESRRQEESRRAAEESHRQDESRRAAEESRRQEESRRAEESRRQDETRRQQDEQRRANEARKK